MTATGHRRPAGRIGQVPVDAGSLLAELSCLDAALPMGPAAVGARVSVPRVADALSSQAGRAVPHPMRRFERARLDALLQAEPLPLLKRFDG